MATTTTTTNYTLPTAVGDPYTTLGCIISWAWETTAGTRPTGEYAIIYDCTKGLPLGGTPDKLETTVLIADKWKTNKNGLQDPGELTIECNWTDTVVDMHDAWFQFATSAAGKGKRLWICTQLEGSAKADYVPVKPSSRQVDPPEPNTVPKYIINFDGEGDPVTAAKPTTYVNKVSSDGTASNKVFDVADGTFKAGSSS